MRVTLIASLAFIAGACSHKSTEAERAVRATYDGYKAAILGGRGADAVLLVDQNTIDYYGEMLELARSGSEDAVRARSVIDKITILLLRHRVSPNRLKEMNAQSVFVHAVDSGWIGKNAVINNELGEIVVSGDDATGVHVPKGTPSQLKHRFVREDGAWKLDLTALFMPVNRAMRKVIEKSGKSEDEFVVQLVTIASGTNVPASVWKSRNGG